MGPRNSVRVPLIQVRPLSAGCRRVWASDRIEAVRAIAPEVRQGAAQLAAAVLDSQPVSLCGEFVFVEQPAEPVAPTDSPLVVGRRDGPDLRERRCSASVIVRLRACCTTQAPSGLAVMPARYTRRRDNSMKKST